MGCFLFEVSRRDFLNLCHVDPFPDLIEYISALATLPIRGRVSACKIGIFGGNGNKGDRKANRSKAASGMEGRAYNREASGEVNGEQSLIAVMPPAICGRIFKHSRSLVVVE